MYVNYSQNDRAAECQLSSIGIMNSHLHSKQWGNVESVESTPRNLGDQRAWHQSSRGCLVCFAKPYGEGKEARFTFVTFAGKTRRVRDGARRHIRTPPGTKTRDESGVSRRLCILRKHVALSRAIL